MLLAVNYMWPCICCILVCLWKQCLLKGILWCGVSSYSFPYRFRFTRDASAKVRSLTATYSKYIFVWTKLFPFIKLGAASKGSLPVLCLQKTKPCIYQSSQLSMVHATVPTALNFLLYSYAKPTRLGTKCIQMYLIFIFFHLIFI
jgi:hypothetical protein